MKEIFYTADNQGLFRVIKQQKPKDILFDFSDAVFVFDTFHILAQPNSLEADSQNKFDEAITLEFSLHNSPYSQTGKMSSLCKNPSIEKVWIMRTLLYFTDFKAFKTKDEAISGFSQPTTDAQKKIHDLISESTGGYSEVVTNPTSKEAGLVNKEFANLVDKGILFQTGDKQLFGCYAPRNGFNVECKKIEIDAFQKEIMSYYELIEVI